MMMKQIHKVYNRTPKKNFNENVAKYIEENNLTDSLIPYNFLFQVRGTLPKRLEIGKTKDGSTLLFEEKECSLRNRHYGYVKKISFNMLCSNGQKSIKIKNYDEFLNNYYYTDNIMLNDNFLNLDTIAKFFGVIKNQKKKIERKQFRFSLTDEEHEIVKEFVKRLKKTIQAKNEKIIIPKIDKYKYKYEEEEINEGSQT